MSCAPLLLVATVATLFSACQSPGDPRAEVVTSYGFFAQWARGDVSESSFDVRFPPLSPRFTSWTHPRRSAPTWSRSARR